MWCLFIVFEGLGDSNYSTFQGTPRKIEKCMVHLGAKRLFASGVADDQAGYDFFKNDRGNQKI